jgi:hypothetical protein
LTRSENMHKVDGESAGEGNDEISMSQVTGFYKEMFNEFKPKPKAQGATEFAEQNPDGSHMD